jgi:acetolactate synthase I/II/III large subunit
VKLAEAYGWKGIRIEGPDQLDDGIAAMLAHDGPVMVDCMVAKLANCFPMIPSGAAHNEMLLGPADKAGNAVSEEGMVLV